ncbi:MAG: LuxR C-terminal-related transcriptional regulator [Nocardioides sp.]
MASSPHRRVAITSDQSLVAEAVGAALTSRGFDVLMVRWPATPLRDEHVAAAPTPPTSSPPDVALLLSDLDHPARVAAAVQLMLRLPVPWVVLSGAPRGPVWGELLEVGAAVVAPSSTTLEEVAPTLLAVAEGREAMGPGEREELTAAWRTLKSEQDDLAARVASMTPRETEVLRLLYAGTPVAMIALQLRVSEATVRSQVKRVLRKLDVRSQLAAVAAFEGVQHSASSIRSARPAPRH